MALPNRSRTSQPYIRCRHQKPIEPAASYERFPPHDFYISVRTPACVRKNSDRIAPSRLPAKQLSARPPPVVCTPSPRTLPSPPQSRRTRLSSLSARVAFLSVLAEW